MKQGIIRAIADNDLKAALAMLERCQQNRTVDTCYCYIATALQDGSGIVMDALVRHTLAKIRPIPDTEFVVAHQ